jgi:hypothetical protein
MVLGTCAAALAGLLALTVVGCGGDSDRAPTPTASSTTPASSPDLDKYLLQGDEVPGLHPLASPHTDTGPPFDLTPDGAERLQRSGYISATYQPAEGDRSGGVSSVLLFDTAAGARDWMAYETSAPVLRDQFFPGARIGRFRVPDVPDARGFTGPDLHGNPIGHVYWTQGRCMMLIGLEVDGPRVERLSAGARAVHERTGGTCPD